MKTKLTVAFVRLLGFPTTAFAGDLERVLRELK
jgi:hypothetical protein